MTDPSTITVDQVRRLIGVSKEVRMLLPKDSDPVIILFDLLQQMSLGPVSTEQAGKMIWDLDSFASSVWAEMVMDEIWEDGLCYCRGEYHDYDYALTQEGKDFLDGSHR